MNTLSAVPVTELARPSAWLETYCVEKVSLNNPQTRDINISDIAVSLANSARYIGHTHSQYIYSQAAHSIWVAKYLYKATGNSKLALNGLMADAFKAYVGDIAKPVRFMLPVLDQELRALEERIQLTIMDAFGLPLMTPDTVRWIANAKGMAMKIEALNLMRSKGEDWPLPELDEYARAIGFIKPINRWMTEKSFVQYFALLNADQGITV